jgi:murein DD-endopeptidase MepM/ murein hydrolase activator NlpD
MQASIPRSLRVLVGAVLIAAGPVIAAPASAHQAPQAQQDAGTAELLESMTCPVAGEAEFADSWGDRRSGGRRHEGVDMAADRGTPVVATVAGFAEFKNTTAGGRSIWLTTPRGDKFFYAHLDRWEGDSRNVANGEIIGYVGSTGNAGGPHLHFEVRPGGQAVNPFPPTSAACSSADDARSDVPVDALGVRGRLIR